MDIDWPESQWSEFYMRHGAAVVPSFVHVPQTITDSEARELLAYMERQYLSPNAYPALKALLDRLEKAQRGSTR